jgi:hypothetical protein
MTTSHSTKGEWSFRILVTSVILMIPVALVIVLCQGALWFKSGVWPDWSPSGLGYFPPETEYLGFNKLLFWAYQKQLALWSVVVGGVLGVVGFLLSDD